MIIDCHCHAGEGDGFTGPWDTVAPLGRYLIRARRAGIDRVVLFSAFHSDYARANRIVARIVARAPARFIAFAFVNARSPPSQIRAELDAAMTRHGFVGIKVHAHDGRLNRAVCDAARRLEVPILYDVMGDVGSVELIAREYPSVPFIIPHLGSFADDWRAQRAFIDVLARLPNVYTDTAGVRRFDLLVEALQRAGPTKVLFGSDGPWLHPGVELAKIRALELPSSAERLILGGNLLRLIRVPRAWRRSAAICAARGRASTPTKGADQTKMRDLAAASRLRTGSSRDPGQAPEVALEGATELEPSAVAQDGGGTQASRRRIDFLDMAETQGNRTLRSVARARIHRF